MSLDEQCETGEASRDLEEQSQPPPLHDGTSPNDVSHHKCGEEDAEIQAAQQNFAAGSPSRRTPTILSDCSSVSDLPDTPQPSSPPDQPAQSMPLSSKQLATATLSRSLELHSPSTNIVGTPFSELDGQSRFEYPFPSTASDMSSPALTVASTSSTSSLNSPLALPPSQASLSVSHIAYDAPVKSPLLPKRHSRSSSDLSDVLYHSPPLPSQIALDGPFGNSRLFIPSGRGVPSLVHPQMKQLKEPPMPPSLREKIQKRWSAASASDSSVGLGIHIRERSEEDLSSDSGTDDQSFQSLVESPVQQTAELPSRSPP